MKAISLWQPWASLVACGAKRIETRSWAPKYRGELAIHAAQRRPRNEEFQGETFERMVQALGVADFRELPRGAILATTELAACVLFMDPEATLRLIVQIHSSGPSRRQHDELAFGDFTAGRYGWVLGPARPLIQPVQMRGHQQLFNVDRALVDAARA